MSNEARKLPTRPGWWWYHDPSSPHGVCVYVGKSPISGQMILDTNKGIIAADECAGEFPAPIPGPAVLAALAEYGDAVVDARDEGEARVLRIMAGGSNSAADLMEAVEEKEYRAELLADAILSERDGGA